MTGEKSATGEGIYTTSPGELAQLPYNERVSSNIEQYNTANAAVAEQLVRDAAEEGNRVQITVFDPTTDLMVPVFDNPGHGVGITASYLVELMDGDRASLAEQITAFEPDVKEVGFYQINIIERS